MKVRSEDLSKVRFPEGRRGYDGDKVDAVLSEIIETLREYEAADEALHRTFVEAQRIKDEMVAEAEGEAASIKASADNAKAAAQIEAEKLAEEAKNDAAAKRRTTEENVAKAKAEIDRRIADADGQASEKTATAEREAAAIRAEASKDAEQRKIEAMAEAKSLVRDAKKEATGMLTEATAEHDELSRKVPQLRTAVSDIKGRLIQLAEAAEGELEVVDGMIDLVAEEAAVDVTATVAAEPEEAPAPEPAPAIEALIETAPVAQEVVADPEPVDEPAAEVAPDAETTVFDSSALKAHASDLDSIVPEDESKETFYGSGLRRRLTEGTKSKKSN